MRFRGRLPVRRLFHPDSMNVLSLCSGIAGLELGIRSLYPAARTVAYVEGEAYAVAVLATRMEDGHLSSAPIYSSLGSFPAGRYRGKVDLVTAGFPCQPFSVAGKQKAEKDPRHLWPDIARIIGECEPALVFLENVSIRAFVEPWRDLRRLGFNLSRPFACTAAELGAGHLRRRVFVLAYHRRGQLQDEERRQERREGVKGATSGNAASSRLEGRVHAEASRSEQGFTPRNDWWASEPTLERVVHGVLNRVDRDRALGNAVVPAQAAFAFEELFKCIES